MEEIFGGLSTDRDGLAVPSIMGRLCQWLPSRPPPTFANYQDFKDTLKLDCQVGNLDFLKNITRLYPGILIQDTGAPGILRFQPDYEMPSEMYYQVIIRICFPF